MAWEKAHEIRIMMLLEATFSISGKQTWWKWEILFFFAAYFFKSWMMSSFSLKTNVINRHDEQKLRYLTTW